MAEWQVVNRTFEDGAECDIAEIRRLLDEDHYADAETVP